MAGFKISLFLRIKQRNRVLPTTKTPGFMVEDENEEVKADSVMGWCVVGAAAAALSL